jgi:hypothetical protein
MPKESVKARCTQAEARAAYISAAEQLWETFIAWYDAHPDATFDEMEEVAGEQGRGLLGDVLALAVRRGDLGATPEAPRCEQCGRAMVFKGYPEKDVHGLRADAEIPRAYYICPHCEAGVFPPGSAPEAKTGSME